MKRTDYDFPRAVFIVIQKEDVVTTSDSYVLQPEGEGDWIPWKDGTINVQ